MEEEEINELKKDMVDSTHIAVMAALDVKEADEAPDTVEPEPSLIPRKPKKPGAMKEHIKKQYQKQKTAGYKFIRVHQDFWIKVQKGKYLHHFPTCEAVLLEAWKKAKF